MFATSRYQFPQPCVKGDGLAISISEDEYITGIEMCKHNLHGPSSLGNHFARDFNPNLQKNTTAQVWVRFYGLAQEYWRPKILFAIASSIRTPICTDAIVTKPMFDRTFGQYVRVLVDMDLSQTIRYKVLVERVGFAFFVEMDYENLPSFCTHCNMVGHYVEVCKKFHGNDDEAQPMEPKNKAKQKNEGTSKYVQKKDGRTEQNKTNEVVLVEDSDKVDSPQQIVQEGSNTPIEVDKSKDIRAEQNKNIRDEAEKSKNTNDEISGQNRFIALADQEVNEGELNLDKDRMISDENSSTQEASEFVDDTQMIQEEVIVEKATDQFQSKSQDKVQKDMQFLKESWANMAENEEDETRLLEALDKGHSPSGFQLVVSKAKNKEKAKSTSTSSSMNRYGTRSQLFLEGGCRDNQCVAFTLSDLDKVFGVAAVYASNCYVSRRNLWSSLSTLNSNNDIPWCFLGDFNVIMGLHEYKGNHSPTSL
ncbi:hypothetical protein A2U01_0003467 [Trifolium medium]|uniref:DUF4283 domain protein n=1 Tax=Trifolium medium TaxID=97028 RepID=A0A392M5P5_9FABA|nr:hypothetical protein [Trifolium medium]